MATLSFKNIKKTYPGNVAVIHGISMDIKDGEFIVIVGPSGCGKSTLMRMVAGLETVTEGDIQIDEKSINHLEPAQRDIAMVFQNYALYPHMSVFDNMAYGLKIRKMSKEQIKERVQQTAETLELALLLDRRPKQLSGGQRQRVAMGRAIVREPKVFLFDEPLSNLDAKLRVQMRLEIQKLHRRLATTSLYVTHDQVEAMTLAQRMIIMNKGVAEQVGTPMEVFERPASTFVASFIGSPPMNLLNVNINHEGKISTEDGIDLPINGIQLPESVRGKTQAIMGFRPENCLLHETGIPVKIEMVETLGSEQLIHGLIGQTNIVIRQNIHANAQQQAQLKLGNIIHVSPDADHALHWFDPETTRRLN